MNIAARTYYSTNQATRQPLRCYTKELDKNRLRT